MNKRHMIVLVSSALVTALLSGCGGSNPTAEIAVTSGSGQSALPNGTFQSPLIATVTRSGKAVANSQVVFNAPSSGPGATFDNGTATEMATSDANGVATSSRLTANATAGAFSVKVTAAGATANFDLTTIAATYYSFAASGQEFINNTKGPNYYALAGSVAIDAKGNVVGGEQDYNDGFGVTSSQPTGDSISGGTLTIDAAGQGTLTLITNNTALGSNGTETLGIQFANANHAMIVQFDGSATSSGSLDTQTLPSPFSGGYAFTLSGVDKVYHGTAFGGVFTVNGTALNGTVDLNDNGTLDVGEPFSGTATNMDNFGRGQLSGITINGDAMQLNCYIIGPEAIRMIDVGTTEAALGAAFGQGANTTGASNASLRRSVFGIAPHSWGYPLFAALGMLTPDAVHGTFTGVADNDEENVPIVRASAISGTYKIAANGYGSLSITNGGLIDVKSFGLYATDPNLNLLDPNNANGGGGALIIDLDAAIQGSAGILIPQSDVAASSFSGNYVFGAQDFNGASAVGWEFDHLGHGSVAAGVLTGSGLVNDAFGYFNLKAKLYASVPFSGSAVVDSGNPGRYVMTPLNVSTTNNSPNLFSVTIYQANGGQLFWMDEDALSLSLGSLQQQGSLAGLHAQIKKATFAGR